MINRRILRIKAMQALYSYFVMKGSLFEVIESEIEEKYALDPAIHDFKDKSFFHERHRNVREAFKKNLDKKSIKQSDEMEADLVDDTNHFIGSYYSQLTGEKNSIKSAMVKEANGLYDAYIKMLMLIVAFAFIEKQDREKGKPVGISGSWNFNLAENIVARLLLENPEMKKKESNSAYSWAGEIDVVRKWYREITCKNEEFIAHQALKDPTPQEQSAIILHLFKKVIFKNENIASYFIENDLYWVENRSILKNLVIKTIKSAEDGQQGPLNLLSLSLNKEDDFEFFEKLFEQTTVLNDELEKIIGQKTRNWDINRIARLDMIILKMALTEMITFPSIPVKVSINEFIEISKIYSTPKSKQFINGILDVLANELTSEKRIRKSGRGLIDNK